MKVFLSFITGGGPLVGRFQEKPGVRSQESGVGEVFLSFLLPTPHSLLSTPRVSSE